MSGIILKPTEIILMPFPFTNLASVKKRPGLVIREMDKNNDFICVPLTSQDGHPASIMLTNEELTQGSLPKLSWVRTDKIFTFNVNIVVGRVAQLNENSFNKIKQQICKNLQCC